MMRRFIPISENYRDSHHDRRSPMEYPDATSEIDWRLALTFFPVRWRSVRAGWAVRAPASPWARRMIKALG